MRVRRRAFALMLAVLAAAAVFAAAANGLVVLRTATVETGAVAEQAEARRTARAAAVIAIEGMVARPDAGRAPDADSPLDEPLPGEEPAEEDTPELEIPPWMREILGEQADELEEQAEQRTQRQQRSNDRRQQRRGIELIKAVGIPHQPLLFAVHNRPVRVTLRDANATLSVNNASAEQLARLFRAHRVEFPRNERIANQIKDWTDADNFAREGSFEQDHYRSRGITARNAPIRSLRELLYLPDMTPATFRLVEDTLSVGAAEPHLPSAPREVLRGFGFEPPDIDTIESARARGPIDLERLRTRLSPSAEELLEGVTLDPSGILLARIEVFNTLPPDAPTDPASLRRATAETAAPRRFDAIAIVTDRGLRDLALRPAHTPTNTTGAASQ